MRATLSTARAKRGTMMKRVGLAGSITPVLIACAWASACAFACGAWESSALAADASADAAVDDAGALADASDADAAPADSSARDDAGQETVDSGADASAPGRVVASQTGDTCAVSRGAGAGAGEPAGAPVAIALGALVSALAARRFRVAVSRDDRA